MQFLRNLSDGFKRQPPPRGNVPFWQGFNRNRPKFLVTLDLGYMQRVVVGVEAPHEDAATAIVRRALDSGSIWQNSDSMPLLQHAFQPLDPERLVQGLAVREIDELPDPDTSVAAMKCYESTWDLLTFVRQVIELCGQDQDLDDPVSDSFRIQLPAVEVRKVASLVQSLDDC